METDKPAGADPTLPPDPPPPLPKERDVWDDVKRVVTTLSDLNEVIASRPYNASENENADRVAAAALADANRLILQQQGLDAIVNNKAFLTIPTPTNAQVLAQVKALTRQMDGVIRLAANVLDATD